MRLHSQGEMILRKLIETSWAYMKETPAGYPFWSAQSYLEFQWKGMQFRLERFDPGIDVSRGTHEAYIHDAELHVDGEKVAVFRIIHHADDSELDWFLGFYDLHEIKWMKEGQWLDPLEVLLELPRSSLPWVGRK